MARWLPPLRGTVPPSEQQQRCVIFICAEIEGAVQPIGTGFLVSVPTVVNGVATYFVTAKHVVDHGQPTYVRLRRWDGGKPEHKKLGDWVMHPTADVAMVPCDFVRDEYIANHQEEAFWADKHPPGLVPSLGQAAHFVGLLGDVPTLAERAVPMLRAASIGALYVDDVPVRYRAALDDAKTITSYEPQAHLIDTYSRSGFSGSPVYVDYPYVMVQPVPDGMATQMTSFTALLGVLIGHFGRGDQNTGVAIVVPINALRELLADERLIEWRDRETTRMQQRREDELRANAAELDSLYPEPAESSSDRVSLDGIDPEDALRALLKTPPHAQTQDPA